MTEGPEDDLKSALNVNPSIFQHQVTQEKVFEYEQQKGFNDMRRSSHFAQFDENFDDSSAGIAHNQDPFERSMAKNGS